MRDSFLLRWCVVPVMLISALPTSAATIMVGDPQKPTALPTAIYNAYAQGARDITVSPGVYDLPSGKTDTLLLKEWSDVTIHADGVTLIFEDFLGHRPLHLLHCKNVSWDGGTFRFSRPAFTQGRITAISTDAEGDYCDWQIDAGYDAEINPKSTMNIVDAQTRLLKVGCGDWSPQSYEQIGPGLFRLHYHRPGGFAVNDWLVARAVAGTTLIHMDGSQNCTLRNVTLENGGFGSFFETGGEGGNHYLKCRIQIGPRPTGATEDELVSCGADGFHSVDTTTGPDIEDCVFTGIFLDDCIAIHGTFGRVLSSDGSAVVMKAHPPVVGEPLRISDMNGFFAQANCMAVDRLPDNQFQVTLDQELNVPVDHSVDLDPHKGTKANDPDHCGRGYRILRCRLGDTRSRGILVKADDGIIDHCQIEGCAMTGVSIGPEFWWNEANYVWNAKVTNNTFLHCSKGRDQGTLWVHGDGAVGNRNITVANNTFDNCYGPYVLKIEWTDGAQITDNKIDGSFQQNNSVPGNILWVSQSKNVKLSNNVVTHQGPYAGEVVALTPDMNPADVQNNNTAGFSLGSTSAKP